MAKPLCLQVDETMLSDDCRLDAEPLPPPPSYPGPPTSFVSMSLPGGGMVSVPLAGSRGSSPEPSSHHIGNDVLGVTSGEPVTHFNLDQILGIVQSFQLDTETGHQRKGADISKVEGEHYLHRRKTHCLFW